MPWIESIITWFVCVLALGRGGIISSSLLLFLLMVYQIRKKSLTKILFQNGLIFIAVFVIVFLLFEKQLSGLISYTSGYIDYAVSYFEERQLEGSRGRLWTDYVNKILDSPLSILVAPSISGTALLEEYSNNLHNSFIMMYARFGTLFFVFVIYKIICSFRALYKHKSTILMIVLLIACLRSFTDVIAFNGVMDILFYYFIFYPDFYNRHTKLRLFGKERQFFKYSREISNANI